MRQSPHYFYRRSLTLAAIVPYKFSISFKAPLDSAVEADMLVRARACCRVSPIVGSDRERTSSDRDIQASAVWLKSYLFHSNPDEGDLLRRVPALWKTENSPTIEPALSNILAIFELSTAESLMSGS